MSFGGAVSAMMTSLKNNKRERKSALKRLKDSPLEYGDSGKLHFESKATESQLKSIREKIKRENRIRLLKNVIIISVFMALLIYFIGFVKI